MQAESTLFETQLPPLADRVRPRGLTDYIGQEHLVGDQKILAHLVKQKKLFSLILWGPPGTGKTTLARIISHSTDSAFHEISAVSSGVKDLRAIINKGKANRELGKSTLLFIDEIHRFSKSQQDALLHAVEEGTIIIIGATTKNPSFEVIGPLLSRCRVLRLNALDETALGAILDQTFKSDILLMQAKIELPTDVRDRLIQSAGGDARKLLNALEVAFDLIGGKGKITMDILNEALQSRAQLYDKTGDYHYDTISAFIKSVRGSDPDGAIYWLALMLEGGEMPEFIARRLIILASEDVGNADTRALPLAVSGFQAVHMIGMPEAAIVLAQVTTYMAAAPKSNAAYSALLSARKSIMKGGTPSVPLHLRNAPTKLMKEQGYGENYIYPHDHEKHFVKESYLPDGIQPDFYHPTDQGHEAFIRLRLKQFWPERYGK